MSASKGILRCFCVVVCCCSCEHCELLRNRRQLAWGTFDDVVSWMFDGDENWNMRETEPRTTKNVRSCIATRLAVTNGAVSHN